MICPRCARAADQRAPRDRHCTSTGGPGAPCDCQHRTDRYRPLDGISAVAAFYDQLDRATRRQVAAVDAAITRDEATRGLGDVITIPRTTTPED